MLKVPRPLGPRQTLFCFHFCSLSAFWLGTGRGCFPRLKSLSPPSAAGNYIYPSGRGASKVSVIKLNSTQITISSTLDWTMTVCYFIGKEKLGQLSPNGWLFTPSETTEHGARLQFESVLFCAQFEGVGRCQTTSKDRLQPVPHTVSVIAWPARAVALLCSLSS